MTVPPEGVATTSNEPLGAGVAVGLGIGVPDGVAPADSHVCAYEAPAKAPIVIIIISNRYNNFSLRKFIRPP